MTVIDLHKRKVNLTMVSAHYALKALYDEFGADLLESTLESFRSRDQVRSMPDLSNATYSKGQDFAIR